MYDLPYQEMTKAVHIMSVISWMAALFYLPRILVYHADAKIGSDKSEVFKVMEFKLLSVIMIPAMISSWLFGLILIFFFGVVDLYSDIWFHVKLFLVLGMTGFHFYLAGLVKIFAADKNTRPHSFFRLINEIPTVLMILIVFLAVVKPF